MRFTPTCPTMVIKGRSRSNGAQLADYLLSSPANDNAHVLDIRGTTKTSDLKRSLLEMSLSSQLTQRGEKGLYHAQINPAIGEDRPMTADHWLKAADILEEHLGFVGQKRVIVLHEKEGRIHGHVVWEKYDHDTGKLRTDSKNYKKHDQARAQIEQELGHERTPQKAERDPTDKEQLTQLWQQHPEASNFVEAAQEAGYYIAQGNDRRPFRVVTPDGQSLDLVRQLEDIKTKAVRDRLQPIRAELLTEADALALVKADRQQAPQIEPTPEPEPTPAGRDLFDSQELAIAMINRFKQQQEPLEPGQEPVKVMSYDFTVHQPLTPVQEPEKRPDPRSELSDSQDKAAAMLAHYRQRQAEQQRMQQARHQAAENQADMTDQAAKMLEDYRRKQEERKRQRDHDRGLDFD